MKRRIRTRWQMCRVASALQESRLVQLTIWLRARVLYAEQTVRAIWYFLAGIK